MFFFDKRYALKQARKVFAEQLKLGVPENPTKSNRKYKYFEKNIHVNVASSFFYEVCDKHKFSFLFIYHKYKYVNFYIFAKGLNLSDSPNGMRMLKEQYPDFEFLFTEDETRMSIEKTPVPDIKDVATVVSQLVEKWNTSSLYRVLLELYEV